MQQSGQITGTDSTIVRSLQNEDSVKKKQTDKRKTKNS